MIHLRYIILVALFGQSLVAQPGFRETILNGGDRKAILKKQIEHLRESAEQALIATVLNPAAHRESRIAAAVLLMREHKSQQAADAALVVMALEMPAGLNDWEEANDWTLLYPVAAEASLHPDLMPQIIGHTLDGALPESVVGFALLRYQADNHAPGEHLAATLKTNLTPEQRQQCERLIAILKGEAPPKDQNKEATPPSASSTSGTATPVVGQTETGKEQSLVTIPKQLPQGSGIQPASPPRWPVVAVVVVAALGLLWLLLKKRK